MPTPLIRNFRGFDFGFTPVISIGEQLDCQMNFGILRLQANQHHDFLSEQESVYLLLSGEITITRAGESVTMRRDSVFRDAPIALHLAPNEPAKVFALSDIELAVIATENHQAIQSTVFDQSNMLENEHRGQGLLDDTAYRIVRTIFDTRNRPLSNLVIGEVITFPGRWSSYPPHHHVQPEIYHYRFSERGGYGHAELGDEVFKVNHFDTLKILDEKTHSQVSAPGYGMYYLWAIRHLPGKPYVMPTFVEEHAWTKGANANHRVWRM